ncbi:hypothetical protein GCM10029964_106220 [Kibdelosporangium lantanae]
MGVTGLAMLLYVVAHMLGNLKFFWGAGSIDGYAAWLRTILDDLLGHGDSCGSCASAWSRAWSCT